MTDRLLQALQRGGVAAKLERDRWGVWRGQDRRRRQIGVLSGRDVELLRLRGLLAPLGDAQPPTLIWTGPIVTKTAPTDGMKVLRASAVEHDRSLIEQVVANCADIPTRSTFRALVQAYRDDHEWAERRERSPGMNWVGLSLGGRIQGGPVFNEDALPAHIIDARSRLERVAKCVSQGDLRFLNALILENASKSKLASRFAIRSSLLERRAIAILRHLREVSIYP